MDSSQDKERDNKAGTQKMAANDERQSVQQQKTQNDITKSDSPDDDAAALSNNRDTSNKTDTPHIKEQNKERMKSEKDEDFGIE